MGGWEIPREAVSGQPSAVSTLLSEYWQNRQARQKEIDASIARRADTEFLYDQPYEEPKRIRVAGPFTVESLSPHRVLAPDDPATSLREDALNTQDFAGMIIENLRASGVQNTIKKERLKFDRLEPYAGIWIHAAGEYTEKDGKSEPGGRQHRPRTRHGRPGTSQGSRQGSRGRVSASMC